MLYFFTLFSLPFLDRVPESLLPHFYDLLFSHLSVNRDVTPEVLAIVENSTNIFAVALPGVTILIPYFLMMAKRLVSVCLFVCFVLFVHSLSLSLSFSFLFLFLFLFPFSFF
jgi:hypothetical protein